MADNEDPKGTVVPVTPPKPVEAKKDVAKSAVAAALAQPAAKFEPKVDAPAKPAPVKPTKAAPVQPANAAPGGTKPVAAKVKPVVKAAPAKDLPPVSKPLAKAPVAKPAAKIKAEPAAPAPVEPVVPVKAAVPTPVSKVAKDVKEQVAATPGPEAVASKAASKTASTTPVFAGLFSNFMLEETTMDMNSNFNGFQTAVTDAQAKAKAAFDKGTSVLGEVSEFAKGNVEAAVESGKIYAEGVQALGSEFVTESRAAFEKMTGDIKELAAAKSPTDFFKLQGDLARKNFDTAVAYSSKSSEAMLKLFSDTFAPISGRVSVAVEKARSTSAF